MIDLIILIIFMFSIYFFIKAKQKYDNTNIIEKINQERIKEKKELEQEIENKRKEISFLDLRIKNNEDIAKEALQKYWETLEYKYSEKESEYDYYLQKLETNYNIKQDEIIAEIESNQQKLDSIHATRIAAQEALIKEKEIKENSSFYCLKIKKDDLDDIEVLERIKPKLNQPRILCMLIWATYYQKPMTILCNNILGTNIISGIYKITNQKTQQCYIGQALDIAKRWKEHAKCGLGIDTPQNNKLYQSIQEYGLTNFSFELLEKCSREQLNEKEKYYINLYQSYEYGFNSNRGNSK